MRGKSANEVESSRVDVTITILCDFAIFANTYIFGEKMAFFLKTNVQIQI
jgi:hypothetical protein